MREKIISLLKRVYPQDTDPVAIFDMANIIFSSYVHVVSITQHIIHNLLILPEPFSSVIARKIGISSPQILLTKAQLSLIQNASSPIILTKIHFMQGSVTTAISIIHHNICSPMQRDASSLLTCQIYSSPAIASANILSVEMYPNYTYFYTVISTIIMLTKHLFVSFCYLLENILKTPKPEELLEELNISRSAIEELRKSWLIDRIFQTTKPVKLQHLPKSKQSKRRENETVNIFSTTTLSIEKER